MYPAPPKRSLTFIFLLPVLFSTAVSFAGEGMRGHFKYPHFFTQSFESADRYVLHFSKGLMQFSDRRIFFQIIKTNPAHTTQDPDVFPGEGEEQTTSENVELSFLNANSCKPYGLEPLASKSNYFLGKNSD